MGICALSDGKAPLRAAVIKVIFFGIFWFALYPYKYASWDYFGGVYVFLL